MKKLSWERFDGVEFQKFCNYLLLLEVSKFAHLFSAPGSDGGVDQYYNGRYGEKEGKWRFQDKFHFSGNKQKDLAALKADIKTDVKQNWKGEEFIVFITNLNLTNKLFLEYEQLGNDLLKSIGAENCEFIMWHEAKIEALIINNPLVYHWFWQAEQILLSPFEVYFSKELDVNINDSRYQLHNYFVGRSADIDYINKFLNDEQQTTLAVVGALLHEYRKEITVEK